MGGLGGSQRNLLPWPQTLVTSLFRLPRAPAILSRARHWMPLIACNYPATCQIDFFGGKAFSVLMYEYAPYLGWGLIRNPQVAKKGHFCVLAPFEH